MAFAVEGGTELQNQFVASLRLITLAVTLGHDASLIVLVGSNARRGSKCYPDVFQRFGHLRLSVGLEGPEVLIADIKFAHDDTIGPVVA